MAVPKTSSPVFYWVVHANELSELAAPNATLAGILYALAFYFDVLLLDVESFCAADQVIYDAIELVDFVSLAYQTKLKNAVLQKLYYDLCEE